MSEHVAGEEPWLLVEEVAARLGLPLSVLLHRVEAGDIPARRVEAEDGVHYALRLGDLGIELDDTGMRASAIDGEESTMSATFDPPANRQEDSGVVFEPSNAAGVHSAIVSAFNGVPEQAPDDQQAAPARPARPREPQQPPPPWIIEEQESGEDSAADQRAGPADAETEVELPGAVERERDLADGHGQAAMSAEVGDAEDDGGGGEDAEMAAPRTDGDTRAEAEADELFDDESEVAEIAVPPPSRRPIGLLDPGSQSPRGDLAAMSLDARELVAGLLDRWERTLEQRIYTEQRQRFQAELVARQTVVKELQMELHTARAEHAAAQAEKDRILAAKERELADRERDLAETRRRVEEVQQHAATRRRRWFRVRDD